MAVSDSDTLAPMKYARCMVKGSMESLHERVVGALERSGVTVQVLDSDQPSKACIWVLGEVRAQVLVVPWPPGSGNARDEADRLDLPCLWITDHVSLRDGERWAALGVNFADAQGNVHLDLPGLLIRMLGRRRSSTPTSSPRDQRGREWRGPALRIMFHLLCDPTLARSPIRDLARLGGVAPGTVVRLFDDLEELGCLRRMPGRARRFKFTDELRDRWIAEYTRKLRPTLLLGRFEAERPDWHVDFSPSAFGALWGAEPAAARLGADLRPGIWTLYASGELAKLLRAGGLSRDPRGTVEVRTRFWAEELQAGEAELVPRLLVVADLIATRDPRCLDAASELGRLPREGLQ